jgi:hypothetical protein
MIYVYRTSKDQNQSKTLQLYIIALQASMIIITPHLLIIVLRLGKFLINTALQSKKDQLHKSEIIIIHLNLPQFKPIMGYHRMQAQGSWYHKEGTSKMKTMKKNKKITIR